MQAVLLDLDGTLADSRPGIEASMRFMLAELGHDPMVAGDITWAVGPPIAWSISTLLAKYGDTRAEDGIRIYRARYSEVGLYDCAPFPGVPEMLAALHATGRPLCLATSKRRDFAERVVDYLGFAKMIPTVYGALPGGGLDDKKDMVRALMRAQGYDPDGTVMVGDRLHDIEAAKANNLRSIGVLWGYGGREELQRVGADTLAETPADVVRLV
ncbi:MAG TPA: HAD hydrolase-like protein [Rhodopila sp.]|uniref:HAD hydrolase-like protein n=1 Tax=Rhodopila sp. TaxID=2480087 RepID=UPI002B900CB9|nr:HAD hydrolase-like protein [Rhodopila sp.]HVY17737.1 HAD hydrolase-like protein [Rhodopila sp.]